MRIFGWMISVLRGKCSCRGASEEEGMRRDTRGDAWVGWGVMDYDDSGVLAGV
jgi:hypothetical protein